MRDPREDFERIITPKVEEERVEEAEIIADEKETKRSERLEKLLQRAAADQTSLADANPSAEPKINSE